MRHRLKTRPDLCWKLDAGCRCPYVDFIFRGCCPVVPFRLYKILYPVPFRCTRYAIRIVWCRLFCLAYAVGCAGHRCVYCLGLSSLTLLILPLPTHLLLLQLCCLGGWASVLCYGYDSPSVRYSVLYSCNDDGVWYMPCIHSTSRMRTEASRLEGGRVVLACCICFLPYFCFLSCPVCPCRLRCLPCCGTSASFARLRAELQCRKGVASIRKAHTQGRHTTTRKAGLHHGVLHCTAPLDVRNPRTSIAQQRHHGHLRKRQATTCVVLILRSVWPLLLPFWPHTLSVVKRHTVAL